MIAKPGSTGRPSPRGRTGSSGTGRAREGNVLRLALQPGQSPFAPQFRSLAEIRSDKLHRLHDYWAGLCDGDRLPQRAQVEIDRLGYILPTLNLVDVHHDPLDFRFRVHSVKGSDYVNADLTGKSVRDYPDPQYAAFVWAVFQAVMDSRQAKMVSERLFMTGSRIFRWEGVVMPLEDASGRIDKLLVAFELFENDLRP